MKHYFASYWCIKKDGTSDVGQVIYRARSINVFMIELSIKNLNDLERVTLLSTVKISKREYEKNKRIERMMLEGEKE